MQPALDVLGDPRLANARTHLVEAQQRLQEHDPDEAVGEARMAIEYGMLALLDGTGTPRPAKHQPQDLFNALAAPGQGPPVLSRAAEELVLSAPRFRGRTTAGHAGSAPSSKAKPKRSSEPQPRRSSSWQARCPPDWGPSRIR